MTDQTEPRPDDTARPEAYDDASQAPEPAVDAAAPPVPEGAGEPGPQGASTANSGTGGRTAEAAEAEAGDAVTDEERSAEELRAALDDAERAAEEYLDHLRRERAEFENFRKRTTKERMEALDRGAESLIANLLGVLDNFGYTLDAARASEDDQLAKGVEMVHAELIKVLTDAGLEEVPGVGQPFDPAVHEAMLQVDAEEELGEASDEPVVVEVLRAGYRFKGRVLRPASVKVAR